MAEKTTETRQLSSQRWIYAANDYNFILKPVCCKEIKEFMDDAVPMPPMGIDDNSPSDIEYNDFIINMFKYTFDDMKIYDDEEAEKVIQDNKELIQDSESIDKNKIKLLNMLTKRQEKNAIKSNSEFNYSNIFNGNLIVKWIERKVSFQNELIKFQDLEEKFELSHAEIGKMYSKILEISGFRNPSM